jgi:integral membrane protein (TIGR01906 family)
VSPLEGAERPRLVRRVLRGAEICIAALLWASLIVGSAVTVLTVPAYTSALTQALDIPRTAGLPAADVLHLSGRVRASVADREFDPLPATWKGAPAFDAAAVDHLMDVRRVIAASRVATGIAALLLALYVGFCVVQSRVDRLRTGMRAAAVLCSVAVVASVVAAVADFSSFFDAFHGLFFKVGTWTFPADSLLIRLFPERFWEASGAAWALLVMAGAAVLLLVSRLTRGTQARLSASRTANNV